MSIRHPHGHGEQAVKYINLEAKGEMGSWTYTLWVLEHTDGMRSQREEASLATKPWTWGSGRGGGSSPQN